MLKQKGEEAADRDGVRALRRKLSLIYRKLETCGKPWVAALNGTAMGGCFELALACHHRIAADNPKTRLGLPEIKVGLFPGAGGTQRIARMMATADALQFLLKGDQIRLDRAKTMKLVDNVVPAADLVKRREGPGSRPRRKSKQPWDVDGFKLPGGPVWSKMGMMTFPAANALYRKETQDNYPARARDHAACLRGPAGAVRHRAAHRVALLRQDRALARSRGDDPLAVRLDAGAEQGRAPAGQGPPPRRSKKVGVLGAGLMGAGIAYVTAQAGIDVVLIDRDQEAADKGKAYSANCMAGQIKRGRAKQADADALLARITPTPDYNALKGVDLVIEAVFEDRKVKAEATAKAQAVRRRQGGVRLQHLDPADHLARRAESKDPKNFIGMHFFSPVDKMMLVEIIMGEKTADPALAVALDYVRAIRKTPIVVNDSRGFYTSRVVGTYIREGHLMLTEGVPAAMIENVGTHGRHAGRPALAQRRGRGRSRVEDPEGDRSRPRRQGDRPAAEGAARGDGREARPLRAQERQGLLRLSADRPEAAVAGPCRAADGRSSIPTRST